MSLKRRSALYSFGQNDANTRLVKKRALQQDPEDNLSDDEFQSSLDTLKSSQETTHNLEDLNSSIIDALVNQEKSSSGSIRKRKDETETDSADEKVDLVQSIENVELQDCGSSLIKNSSLDEVELANTQMSQIGPASSLRFDKSVSPDTSLQKSKEKLLAIWRPKIPPPLFYEDLSEKAKTFFPVIKDILKGKLKSPYYYHAKKVYEASNKPFLSNSELRSLDLSNFQAGYYGFKRQLRLGEEIYSHYKSTLVNSKSKPLKWWGATDFANYVLAPEILMSVAIEALNLQKSKKDKLDAREKAYALFQDTLKYGTIVADTEPLEKWETTIVSD